MIFVEEKTIVLEVYEQPNDCLKYILLWEELCSTNKGGFQEVIEGLSCLSSILLKGKADFFFFQEQLYLSCNKMLLCVMK